MDAGAAYVALGVVTVLAVWGATWYVAKLKRWWS
jgi:hypothetical protein